MPEVALESATIEYRELGPPRSAHPPVLFVHGILVDHRLWSGVATRLAEEGYRCILPTWPLGSHRLPVRDRAALSPAGVADLIGQFLEALDLEDVTLVGNDTGGGLCQFLVDAHPERIGRLVLTNCDAFEEFPPFPFDLVFKLMRGPLSIRALTAAMGPAPVRHSPLGYGLLANRLDPALTAYWLTPARTDPRIAGDLARLLRAVDGTDLTDVASRLSRFTKPVTLVWGTADRCFTPELGRRLANAFPNSSLVPVADAKTFVPLDDPEAVSATIARRSPIDR